MSLPETDSEDEIPLGWEERSTLEGDVYYVNHETKTTQWAHPATGRLKKITGDLPYGWEKTLAENGTAVYVDHINQKTSYTDPRIAFAVDVYDKSSVFRQKYDGSSTALQILHGKDLSGKVMLVTGANTGIGFETAKSLAFHGAKVIIACRDMQKGSDAVDEIKSTRPKVSIEAMKLDLSDLSKVKDFSNEFLIKYSQLDVLILNAGIFGNPYTLSPDNYELTFQTNHLGHFYLTNLLEPLLIKSSPSRVIVLSSESHRQTNLTSDTITKDKLSPISPSNYSALMAYNNSKMCNILFANVLDSKLKDRGVRCNSVHPGNLVSTNISRSWWVYRLIFAMVRPFTKSMQQSAATSVYCAVEPNLESVGGLYFNNCCMCSVGGIGDDPDVGLKLWKVSEEMISLVLGQE